MPRPSRPWFRFYTEAMHDPKIRELPVAQRWVWIAILSAARQSCVPGVLLVSERRPLSDAGLADLAAVPIRDVRKALTAMESDGMLTRHQETGAWAVTKWGERQFESDDITERTRKHRSREQRWNVPRNNGATFPGTPPETETENRYLPTSSSDSREPVDNSEQEGLIDQAIAMAARRYGEQQVQAGKGTSIDGLAKWWLQENAEGAKARAANLIAEYDLGIATLADALLQPNPPWLRNYRKRATT